MCEKNKMMSNDWKKETSLLTFFRLNPHRGPHSVNVIMFAHCNTLLESHEDWV